MRQLWSIMALTILVSACSSLNVTPPEPLQLPAPGEQPYSGEMTPQLMYAILLAELAVKRGELDVAVEAYSYAAELTHDAEIAARGTRLAIFAKRNPEALQMARVWEQAEPANPEIKHVLALLYMRNGDLDSSLRYLQAIFAREKSPQRVFQQLAQVLAGEEDKARVSELMRRLVAQHANLPEAHLTQARLALVARDFPQVLSALSKADALRPNWWSVYELRSRVYVEQGKWAQAEKALQKAIQLRPKDIGLMLRYARLLFQQGKYTEAKTQFRTILKLRPHDPDVLFPLGLLEMQLEHFAEAEQYFRQLVSAGQRVDDASYYLGLLAERGKRLDEAKQWYQNVRSGEHVYAAVRRYTLIKVAQEGLDATLEFLHGLSFESASDAVRLLNLEGEVLNSAREYGRAFEVYSKALESYPDAIDILYSRSLVAEHLGRLEVMERDLHHIIELDPNNADAMNALGYTWADHNKRLQEAHRLILRALELKPDSAPILDSLGWVLYRMGRHQEALVHLQRAYNMLKDAEVGAHLGEVLWEMGQQKQARKVWREAAQREPDDENLQRVMKKYLP